MPIIFVVYCILGKLAQYLRQLHYSVDLWREYWHMGSRRECDKCKRVSADKLQLVQILLDCQARGDDLEWQSRVGGQNNSGGLNHHDDGNDTDCGGDNDDAVRIMSQGSRRQADSYGPRVVHLLWRPH